MGIQISLKQFRFEIKKPAKTATRPRQRKIENLSQLTSIQSGQYDCFPMTALRQMPMCMNNSCCSCVFFGTSGG
jgi:hypothetical protein